MSAVLSRVALRQIPQPGIAKARPSVPASPFLKWVGGKGRLLSQLMPLLPEGVERMRHLEPFVGGGALFFARQPRRAVLGDVNPALVDTYLAVRDELSLVVKYLRRLERRHDPEVYYEVRERYNRKPMSRAKRAATFIYLNKTCFNGLHRVNRKGEFNVPCGRYKNPCILDEAGLARASAALRHADIRRQSFEELLSVARPGDFVYFDPPYVPVSASANFTSYASGGFGTESHMRLRDVFEELDDRGCWLMLSNSDVPFVRELYADWNLHVVHAARAVNSDASGRGKVAEVVVTSY